MSGEILAARRFTAADQAAFAALSGDVNPMHMDPLAARRTQAGAPVVHGVHMLLWLLDQVARSCADLPPIDALRVRFDKLVYVGDSVRAVLAERDDDGLLLEVVVDGAVALRVQGSFGPVAADGAGDIDARAGSLQAAPVELAFDDMAGRSGEVGFAVTVREMAAAFPEAARRWGARRIAALACSSYLVGMVCPGLHSIFGGLAVTFGDDDGVREGISFHVARTDARFRMVRMSISGCGISGTVESFARHPPTAQAGMAALAARIGGAEFRGSGALVVGGSRGIGELIAKMLAAGGAEVTISFASGEQDARRVQADILGAGGTCEILHYDVGLPAEAQLEGWVGAPDTVYYCATPAIFRRKGGLFAAERMSSFLQFYATGFYDLCSALQRRRPAGIAVFYPSSVAVGERPAEMTEYAMSKAAGEILCADMVAHQQPIAIVVQRLPRLATDQTATLTQIATADAVDTMLPIVRAVQASRFG